VPLILKLLARYNKNAKWIQNRSFKELENNTNGVPVKGKLGRISDRHKCNKKYKFYCIRLFRCKKYKNINIHRLQVV
jgi:hypothetical protein